MERARRRQRNPSMRRIESILSPRITFVASRRQQWIQPQLIVIVDVFVAQCQSVDPLGQHLRRRVADKDLRAVVFKALGQTQGQTQVGIDLAQQQRAPIAGEATTGKIGLGLAPKS